MTITYMAVTTLAPITLICAALAYIHRLGFWKAVRSLSAALWALSLAVPAGTAAFTRVYLDFFRRTMESA